MKIYFALTGRKEPEYFFKNGFTDFLMSFHYLKNEPDVIKKMISYNCDIFIDSGAFSAESLGKPIDIDEYCDFLKETKANNYVCLDVIRNAEETEINLKYMESQGLKPFPVFHKTSHEKWLYKYLEEYDKIALGGAVKAGELKNWLDATWKIILKVKPEMNVHGFGITSPDIMMRYPWTSCDSSSFRSGNKFDRLLTYIPHSNKMKQDSAKAYISENFPELDLKESQEDKDYKREILDIYNAKSFHDFVKEKNLKKLNYEHLINQISLF